MQDIGLSESKPGAAVPSAEATGPGIIGYMLCALSGGLVGCLLTLALQAVLSVPTRGGSVGLLLLS